MRLQTFDGAHAFLFTAAFEEDALQGTFWSGTQSILQWSATRDPDVTLADATTLTFLKPGYDRFTFSFPNLAGEPVSLDDEQFQGKVVLVTLAGSWCPNCHDEAQFMTELYKRYADNGVEVVALMYEHLEDPDAAREHHGRPLARGVHGERPRRRLKLQRVAHVDRSAFLGDHLGEHAVAR